MKPTPTLLLAPLLWAALAAAQSPAPPAAEHAWQQSQSSDPAGTYTFTRFTLMGKFVGANAVPVADRPALTVDCIPPAGGRRGRLLNANLLIGTALKIDYVEPAEIRGVSYYPKVEISLQADAAEPREASWALGTERTPQAEPTDKTAVSVPGDALKKMLRAHTVALSADDPKEVPIEMQFDMPDARPVKAACSLGD